MRCNYCFFNIETGNDKCPQCGYIKGSPAEELFYLNPGVVLAGRFVIGQVLGAGGFGIVYKAWDMQQNIPVAVKEYYPSGLVTRSPGEQRLRIVAQSRMTEFNTGMKRFAAERNGTIGIDVKYPENPSLVHGVSAIDDNDTLYMVMEYIEGVTLTNHIEQNGPMPLEEGLKVIYDILEAVRDVHSLDVIHRDISPDNIILMPNGGVKLIDFGAAKFGKRDSSKNTERVMKPGYSPPEQYEPDGRSGIHTDIYAVGATLYFLLTGYKPEESTNRKTTDLLAAPKSLNEEMPEHISDSILKAMAIDHRLRFKDAEAFTAALKGEKKTMRPEKEKKKLKFRRLVSIAATFLVLGAIGTFAYFQAMDQIPTLNDAEFEVWVRLSGDSFADSQRISAFERIIQDFTEIYPNVDVSLVTISADDYETELEAAISQSRPVLFESDLISAALLAETIDLNSVANNVGANTHFINTYTRFFPDRNQMPTGFAQYGVFINTTFSGYTDPVTDLPDLLASMPTGANRIAVAEGSEAAFVSMFGTVTTAAEEEFFNGTVGAIFADTSRLGDVQRSFMGRYRLLRIDIADAPVFFSGMFSIIDSTRDEVAAKRRFLEDMLGSRAQDYLHIQVHSGFAPLNHDTLDVFTGTFADFSTFFDNLAE